MEIQAIKIFYEVAIVESTIKAATLLGYDQSNISKRIHKLEKNLGRTLFLRTNKGMKLSADGEKFLVYAKQILAIVSSMEHDFTVDKASIRIGATQTITTLYLQAAIMKKSLLVYTISSRALIHELKTGELDCIIVNKEVNTVALKEVMRQKEKIAWMLQRIT